jgi:flagellar basal body rod protein FlgG
MNNSLYIAATGMQAQQLGLDTIANNLTNLSTPGFKSSNVNFQELMYVDPTGKHALKSADAWKQVHPWISRFKEMVSLK